MKFFREHSSRIMRLFANQIGITFFALVLTMAVISMKNDSLKIVVSALSIVFYLFLIYTAMWEAGAADIIGIENGRKPKIPFYAVKVALWASVPNLILGVLLSITCVFFDGFGFDWAGLCFGVLHIIAGLFEAMYVGLFSYLIEGMADTTQHVVVSLLYLASSLPLIAVSAGAYALGLKNVGAVGGKSKKK